METKHILNQIETAGAWLPLTTLRQAFVQHEPLTPFLLEAVRQRAATRNCADIRLQRLATFGVFFLAQHRDRRLLEPLVRLFEAGDPDLQDEWLFSNRLFFFGHRLLAGVCPLDAQTPMNLALDSKLNHFTRSIAVCTLGLLAAYGDITRAEAIQRHRQLFKVVQPLKHAFTDGCWVRAAAKLDPRAFERELQWFLASGRLNGRDQAIIADAVRTDPEASFASIVVLEPLVDLFLHVFPQDMREGEIGFVPNGQIPHLEQFREDGAGPHTN